MSIRQGACLCGAVSFTLSVDPLAVRVCWCRDCQHLAANGSVNMMVPAESLTVSGTVAAFSKQAASGTTITREFCPACGSHLFSRADTRPQFQVVRVGNLADPSSVRPGMNIWADSAPAWACLDPALERVADQPQPPPRPATA